MRARCTLMHMSPPTPGVSNQACALAVPQYVRYAPVNIGGLFIFQIMQDTFISLHLERQLHPMFLWKYYIILRDKVSI